MYSFILVWPSVKCIELYLTNFNDSELNHKDTWIKNVTKLKLSETASIGVVNMNFIHRICFEVCNDFDYTLCLLLVNLKNCGLFFLYVSIRWRWTRVNYWVSKRPFLFRRWNMHLCQYQNTMVYTSLWYFVDYSCKESLWLLSPT